MTSPIAPRPPAADLDATVTTPRSRRALLAGALGGLGGFLASSLGRVSPVAGASGDPVRMGRTNMAAGTNTILQTNSTGQAFKVLQKGSGSALRGESNAGNGGYLLAKQGSKFGLLAKNGATVNGGGAAIKAEGGANKGVDGSSTSDVAVQGVSSSWVGVLGSSTSNTGVYGFSSSSYGMRGISGSQIGVYGSSTSNVGVVGTSTSSDGVSGTTSGGSGRGVIGTALSGTGGTVGVLGESGSTSGIGVFGYNSNASGSTFGVQGQADSGTGTGVSGIANGQFGAGVHGSSAGSSGHGVAGVVSANSGTASAIYGVATNGNAFAGYFDGSAAVTGTLSKGGGSFRIDHPLDPGRRILQHSFVESPDMLNIYNGNVTTDANGQAVVALPDWFEALNRDFSYQLTTVGSFAKAMVAAEVHDNRFTIRTDAPRVKVSWQLTGIRRDAWADANRIAVELDKPAELQGKYLHPAEHGRPASAGVDFAMRQQAIAAAESAQSS